MFKKWLGVASMALFAYMLLRFSQDALAAASQSLSIWWTKVLPSLLPFFVLVSVVEKSGIVEEIAPLFLPMTRALRLPGECGLVIVLGSISGYPIGARMTGALLAKKSIDMRQAERLLLLCHMPGPMFVVGSVAGALIGQPGLGSILLLSQYIAALFLSFVWARFIPPPAHEQKNDAGHKREFQSPGLAQNMTSAVSECMLAMLRVAGFMAIANVLFAIFEVSGLLHYVIRPLLYFTSPAQSRALVLGLFEMSNACEALCSLSLPIPVLAACCSFFLGMGGLSVMLQAISFVRVRIPVLLLTKTLQGALAALISYFWASRLVWDAPAFAAADSPQADKTTAFILAACVLWLILLSRVLLWHRSHSSR